MPETFIRSVPSPVIAFFMNFVMPPLPACSNLTSPWWATIDPSFACTVASASSTFSIFEFCNENAPWPSVSLSCESDCSSGMAPTSKWVRVRAAAY